MKTLLKKRESTFWNFSNKWVKIIIFCLLFVILLFLFFAPQAYNSLCVNRNPVVVKAVIVDVCLSKYRYYYYEYRYNDTLYSGVFETSANTLYGEVGDTIMIRCNKNRPSQSIFNANDSPNKSLQKILGWKETRIYNRSERRCD